MSGPHPSSETSFPRKLFAALIFVGLATGSAAYPAWAAPGAESMRGPVVVAQAETMEDADHSGGAVPGKGSRPLEPRYQPLEPEEKGWYNGSYVFGLSRSLADSTIVPAAKAPLFLFTIPLDIAFLPFALIGGLFG